MPPEPPGERGYGPFSGPSRLLHLQWLLITNVIETPAYEMILAIYNRFINLLYKIKHMFLKKELICIVNKFMFAGQFKLLNVHKSDARTINKF